jgi:hypothetical protein
LGWHRGDLPGDPEEAERNTATRVIRRTEHENLALAHSWPIEKLESVMLKGLIHDFWKDLPNILSHTAACLTSRLYEVPETSFISKTQSQP